MKRAKRVLPPKAELQSRHRGDCLGVAADAEALEALELAKRRRLLDVPPALREAIEQLVTHKRKLWETCREDDYRPSGFVGLGSHIWIKVEVVAALIGMTPPTEGVDAFAVETSTGDAEQLIEKHSTCGLRVLRDGRFCCRPRGHAGGCAIEVD